MFEGAVEFSSDSAENGPDWETTIGGEPTSTEKWIKCMSE